MAKKSISAGFAIMSNDRKILLGKTDKYQKVNNWTIFKGQQENGESLIETATRELKEEANIDIIKDDRLNKNISSSPFFVFGVNDKIVYVYLLIDRESVIKESDLKCNSFWAHNTPEIQEYKWVNIDEADRFVYPSQRPLIEKLKSFK